MKYIERLKYSAYGAPGGRHFFLSVVFGKPLIADKKQMIKT